MKITLLSLLLFSFLNKDSDKKPGKDAMRQNYCIADTKSFSSGNILWEQTLQTFGTIHSGDKIEIGYKFKNTQHANITSVNAYPECGCLSIRKPPLPIPPGKSAIIYIRLNTNSRKGPFSKSVFVTTNIDAAPGKLTLEGNIIE
jgi:hypothetical protein